LKIKDLYISISSIITFCIVILVLASCSSTRFVEEGDYLLNKQKFICENCDLDKSDIKSFIKQKPNKRFWGIVRIKLGVYNFYGNRKTRIAKKIVENAGEAPVIFDEFLAEESIRRMDDYVKSRGYYNAEIDKELSKRKFKPKVKVVYTVTLNDPITIQNYNIAVEDEDLKEVVDEYMKNSLIKSGGRFDFEVMKKERELIVKKIRNKGYYSFNESSVNFIADTAVGNNLVDIELSIKNKDNNNKLYIVDTTFIYSNFDNREYLKNRQEYLKSFDTLELSNNVFVLYKKKLNIKPKALLRNYHIKNSKSYNEHATEKTQALYTQSHYLKTVNIQYVPVENSLADDTARLNCFIQLSPFTKQSYAVELEGTNSAGTNYGAELNLSYAHKNLLKGNEYFTMSSSGAVGRTTVLTDTSDKAINTIEYGINGSLESPAFLLPLNLEEFNKKYAPKTLIEVGYTYQKNPKYERKKSDFSFGYYWKPNGHLRHQINPININAVDYRFLDKDFENYINERYVFRYSYKDYFISSLKYSLLYYNYSSTKIRNYMYFSLLLESAGNLLYFSKNIFDNNENIQSIEGTENINTDKVAYDVFGMSFAQYVKTDIDFRYYIPQSKYNKTVFRIFSGLAYPYGNIDVVPNIKQYFSGGANSIRAWPAMSLGPGSFVDPAQDRSIDMGDMKIELNMEQRFHLFWQFHGALFIDVGNVWSVRHIDAAEDISTATVENGRDKALFSPNFYKDIAVGTGAGLRLDFSFFVFRFDVGIKARDPIAKGEKWVFWNNDYDSRRYNMNFGIGYPF